MILHDLPHSSTFAQSFAAWTKLQEERKRAKEVGKDKEDE